MKIVERKTHKTEKTICMILSGIVLKSKHIDKYDYHFLYFQSTATLVLF